MSTGTTSISEMSAATIFTSFDFHLFDFLVKGRYMCVVCVCALLSRSLVTVSGRLATKGFRHQPTRHQETITPPITDSPPNKVVEVN